MEAVRQWAFSICSAMVVCGIALQLMPKSSMTNIFKLVISVFFLCCLLSPIITRYPQQRIQLEEYSASAAEEKTLALKRVMETQTQAQAERNAEKNISDKLRQMGINYHDITINININGQSGEPDSVDIVLDKSLEPEHDKTLARLKAALGMDVRLGYAEKEL